MHLHKIFVSIDGEVSGFHQGRLTCFVRLQGCNLRCAYCDTKQAQVKATGRETLASEVLANVLSMETRKVTITGGEPMLQEREVLDLASLLVDQGKMVSIETNGSLRIEPMEGVSYIMDYKLPSSGESQAMNIYNFENLGPRDFVKFVISDFPDYIKAIDVMPKIRALSKKVNFAMSPMFKGLEHNGRWLYSIVKDDRLDVVFNLQLHKILNVD